MSIAGITFDANEDKTITWQVSGDIQTAYKIDILLNSDNSLAFTTNQVNSYSLSYTLPHGTLTNGVEYKIKITLYNQSGDSITTDGDVFQTSSTPVVTVDTIGTVSSFSYNFTGEYSQAEGVSLRNYTVNLYDASKNLLSTSGIQTSTPLQYLFSNLQTETNYYIEFQATSSKGLTGTSGLILFSVFYLRPKMSVNLQGNNIDNAGIELTWFVSQIILQTESGNPTFINNEKIDLTSSSIVANSGFTIDQNFTLKLWLENVPSKTDLITLTGANGKITLQYHFLDSKFHLYKTDNLGMVTKYECDSAVNGSSYFVLIQQIGMDFNIQASVNS